MKDFFEIFQFEWKHIKSQKLVLIMFIVINLLESMIGLASAMIFGNSIDRMLVNSTMEAIISSAILFLGLNLFSFVIGYFAKTSGQMAMELCVKECKMTMTAYIEKLSLNYVEKTGSSSFMQRMNYDIQMLIMYVLNTCSSIPQNILVFLIALIVIAQIDLVCAFMAVIELPIIVILYKSFESKLAAYARKCADKREEEYTQLNELVMDVGHIKKNGIYKVLQKRYEKAEDEYIKSTISCVRLEYLYSVLNENMDVFLRVFLFFYGGISVINGKMTVGEFTIVYSFFSMITSSCAYFLNFGKQIQDAGAFYHRLKEIVDVPEESNGDIDLDTIDTISFSHVDFGYNENEIVVKDFSYTFEKGKMYVVAGENGSGKSTMISMLSGMYIDEFNGQILYNNIPIQALDMRKIRKEKMGICEQEPFLINDTIRFNMIYSNENVVDDKLMKLADVVSFDNFLKNSENGLDTMVGESGNNLSGGQKQKTALVKVFYKNPDVMILDEPTSAMDTVGQEQLINYLSEIRKDKIIIVVTHDPVLMECADEVVRM